MRLKSPPIVVNPENPSTPSSAPAIENRSDDTPEIMKKRIAIFKEHTAPLMDKFTEMTEVITIDASQTIQDVTQELHSKLNA